MMKEGKFHMYSCNIMTRPAKAIAQLNTLACMQLSVCFNLQDIAAPKEPKEINTTTDNGILTIFEY